MSLGNLDRKDISFVVFNISNVSIPSFLFIFFLSYNNADNARRVYSGRFYGRFYH